MTTCHIRLKETHYLNYGDIILNPDEPSHMCGIYVDIAPFENTPNNKFIRKIDGYLHLMLLFAMSCVTTRDVVKYFRKNIELTNEERNALAFKVLLGKIFGTLSISKWCRIYDCFASKNKNCNSEYVAAYTGLKDLNRSTFVRKKVLSYAKCEFERNSWNIPVDYDYYLQIVYGDYMKLPAVENRRSHPVIKIKFNDN